MEQRAAIDASYDELFNALDVLSRAFGHPAVRTLPPPGETSRPQTRPPGEPGFVVDDHPELRMHVDAWQVALGLAEATSNDPRAAALRDHVRFQTEGAPAALLAMREHLTIRRAAALASLGGFPSGRKKHEGADRRAFTIMLVDGMRDLVGSPQLEFVTTMTEVVFGGGDNVYTLEGTRSLVSGQAARDAARRR